MKAKYCTNLALSIVALSVHAFGQELPTQKMLTLDVAQAILQEAMATCHAEGFKVTVVVVDQANTLKAFMRDDGTALETVETGRMKTNTVMAYGRPSGPPANFPPGTPVPPPMLPGTTNARGGLPIKAGDQLIGAVSVSGAPAEKDIACAKAGLAKVEDRLK